MTQDRDTGILGISLVADQLRIVEGRKRGDEFLITQVAQGRARHPFTYEAFADKNMPRRFAEDIMRLYSSQSFESKQVAFSLDSRMVLAKKLPIDNALEVNKIEDHIDWEVRQFSISPIDEYVIDFEELNSEGDESFKEMLVVLVRKKIVRFLKQIFKHTDLKLKVVDVDMFSAQRALQLNYDYNSTDKVGLIDVEDKKIHFSLLFGRSLKLFEDFQLDRNNHFNAENQDSKTRLISKELRRIILERQFGKGIEDLKEIYLYGEAVEDSVLEELQNTHDVRIDRANPFRKVKLSSKAREQMEQARSECFMVAVGAALRGIQ